MYILKWRNCYFSQLNNRHTFSLGRLFFSPAHSDFDSLALPAFFLLYVP